MNDYVARAIAGCEFLDTHFGGRSWRDRIDVDELDISDRMACVIGQLFLDDTGECLKGYVAAQRELRIDGNAPLNAALGFDLSSEELEGKDFFGKYDELTAAWKLALTV